MVSRQLSREPASGPESEAFLQLAMDSLTSVPGSSVVAVAVYGSPVFPSTPSPLTIEAPDLTWKVPMTEVPA